MKIYNLTQHKATPEQIAGGVIDLDEGDRKELSQLLTFETIPVGMEMYDRAVAIAHLAEMREGEAAMIGGAPFFMSILEQTLGGFGIQPLYAFSVRESVDVVADDGTVTKTAVFRHKGWVKP